MYYVKNFNQWGNTSFLYYLKKNDYDQMGYEQMQLFNKKYFFHKPRDLIRHIINVWLTGMAAYK